MRNYEKPFLAVIEVSDNDIIQTSGLTLGGSGNDDEYDFDFTSTTSVDANALATKY